MTNDTHGPHLDSAPHDLFEAYPAPSFIVDEHVTLLRVNRAGVVMVGQGQEPGSFLRRRGCDALHCLRAGEGEDPDRTACADCVIRSAVAQALAGGIAHRARGCLQVTAQDRTTERRVLVSAAPIVHDGGLRALLTIEDVTEDGVGEVALRPEDGASRPRLAAESLALFPEVNPEPVLRLSADATVAYANRAARSALAAHGVALDSKVGPEVAAGAARALASRERTLAEVVCGEKVYALSFQPVGPEVNVYGHEVTELKHTIEQLAREKDRLRVTLGSIGDGVIVTDERGRVTLVNAVAEELTGWTREDALGRSIEEVFRIVSEVTRSRAENPVRRAMSERSIVGLANHTALIARDGAERPIADSAAPIRDASGDVCGAVLVFRDQTKEREAESALRASERRTRLKLEAILSPEGDLGDLELGDIIDPAPLRSMMEEFNRLTRIPLAIIDVRGKVLVGVDWQDICTRFHRVNPETCRHCIESDTTLTADLARGEIRRYCCKNSMWDVATPIFVGGHHLGNVFMGQFFYDDEQIDREAFRAQAARFGFDEREYLAALDRVPRLGRQAVAAAMAFFLKFAEMLSVSSYSNLKLARSMAEGERLMRSLAESNEHLQQADRRKTEFLGVLSHELRNPLAPIRNALYVLDQAAPGSDQAGRARAILRRQVEHLTRLVDDLLDVTRISHGKIALTCARLDVRDLVTKTCDDNRSVCEEEGVGLHVQVPPAPVWVDADATRVSQVIGNLVQNAAKFTPPGGRIDVAATSTEDHVEISVRDTGIGLEGDELERMFEPFAQADQGLARTNGGLGLGLALVRGLVELHGGVVRARSPGRGRGATFSFTLPLAR